MLVLKIQLTMTETSDFDIEARPASETIEVCGNSAETLEYEIVPRELGDLPIRGIGHQLFPYNCIFYLKNVGSRDPTLMHKSILTLLI